MDKAQLISRRAYLQSGMMLIIAEVIDMLSAISKDVNPWLTYKDLEEVLERLNSAKESNLRALEVHHILTWKTGAHD